MSEDRITRLARALGRACLRCGAEVVTAESCTGGGVAEAITRVAGSSRWFGRGFVAYENAAKHELLGVRRRTVQRHGAVSEAVAREMALGALRRSTARLAVAITGIAGPGGGSADKPVGLVWIAWAVSDGACDARAFRFRGGRAAIRRESVAAALEGLVERLRAMSG